MNAHEAWNAAYAQLELQLDRPTFEMWVRGAALLEVQGETFVIAVRNAAARDMLSQRLYRNVQRLVCDYYGGGVELRFEVRRAPARAQTATPEDAQAMPLFRLLAEQPPGEPQPAPAPSEAPENADVPVPLHQRVARPKMRELPDSVLNASFTFERFIPGSANEMVYSAARAVAEHPAVTYNPFFVHGGVGLGKSHLIQAIAHVYKARGLRAVYVPAEAFTNDLVEAIRSKSTAMFRERYRSIDALLIDDVQFLRDKESTQEEFFHTFNVLHQFNRQIVIASDEHPARLSHLEARLRSRFEGGLVMDIQLPTLETRIAILQMWAREQGVTLEPHVAEFVAARVRKHLREMEGIFKKLVIQARMTRSTISIDEAEEEIAGFSRTRHPLTLQTVIETTARHHGLASEDLTGPCRTRAITSARQIAMLLCRELTGASLPQIGSAFGGRAHSTVLHSCKRAAEECGLSPTTRSITEDIRRILLRSS